MIVTFKSSWFSEHPRKQLGKIIDDQLAKLNNALCSFQLYDQPDKDMMYNIGLTTANLNYIILIRYLCVDPSGAKPWILRKSIKHVVEFEQFREYCEDINKWLCKHPPTEHYTSLVHVQTLIKLLTTMEYKDG